MLTGANAFGTGPADRPSTHRRFHITDHGDTDGHSCRATFTRAAGQFDLSIGINIALASVVAAKIVEVWGWPMWLGAAVALSTLVGAVIGTFVTRVQVHSLIASLGVATVLEGVNLRITDGRPIIVPEGHELEHTPVGGRLHAVGVNASAAHLSGIGVNRMVLMSFACSGLLAGLAGVLQMTRSGGNPQTGPGLLLPVFAAAFLGSTVIKRTFNVWGTVIAVLGLAFTVSGLTLNGAKPYVELWFNGAALLIAVSFTALISRLRGAAGRRDDPPPTSDQHPTNDRGATADRHPLRGPNGPVHS